MGTVGATIFSSYHWRSFNLLRNETSALSLHTFAKNLTHLSRQPSACVLLHYCSVLHRGIALLIVQLCGALSEFVEEITFTASPQGVTFFLLYSAVCSSRRFRKKFCKIAAHSSCKTPDVTSHR